MIIEGSTAKKPRGRPRDSTLTDEERRQHRRLRPTQPAPDFHPLVTVTLKLAHNRNGQWVGPGVVAVPSPVAAELLYSEEQQSFQQKRLQDFWPGG